MVNQYLHYIKKVQPEGSYAVAGYSFGAMLAFEISKRLETWSDEVKFLGSFDLQPHIKTRIRQLNRIEVALDFSSFLDLYSEDRLRGLSSAMHLKSNSAVMEGLMLMAPLNKE